MCVVALRIAVESCSCGLLPTVADSKTAYLQHFSGFVKGPDTLGGRGATRVE